MSRTDRPQPPTSSRSDSADAARRRVAAVAAIACLYRQWRLAGREIERLARDLSLHDVEDGFVALDRVHDALLVTDALLDLVSAELAGEVAIAAELRVELFEELIPWLAAVRHQLPSAATLLYSFTAAAATWRTVSLTS